MNGDGRAAVAAAVDVNFAARYGIADGRAPAAATAHARRIAAAISPTSGCVRVSRRFL